MLKKKKIRVATCVVLHQDGVGEIRITSRKHIKGGVGGERVTNVCGGFGCARFGFGRCGGGDVGQETETLQCDAALRCRWQLCET